MSRLLVWISHPPFSTSHLSEAARVSAMANAFEAEPEFLFISEGVRCLVKEAEPFRLGPPIDRLLQGLVTPERPGLVDASSLRRRGIDPERLTDALPLRLVSAEEIAERLLRSDRMVTM